MRPYAIIVFALFVSGTLALAACAKSDKPATSPAAHFKQGASEIIQGAKQAVTQIKASAKDSAITAHVKARLATNQGLASFSIHVDTKNGVVTLAGRVDSQAAKNLAAQIASKTDGVRVVVNDIQIKSD